MYEKKQLETVTEKEPALRGRSLSRLDFLKIAAVGGAGVAAALTSTSKSAYAQKSKPALDTLTLECVAETQHTIFLKICAGSSGAPAGFSLHWVNHSDYPNLTCGASGQEWPSTGACDPGAIPNNCNVCSASFSGVPGCSNYNLGPNGCVIVEIGNLLDSVCGVSLHNCAANELDCSTEYVFRAFAHANSTFNRSPFSANHCCSTESCAQGGCTFTQGYWKTHGPAGCNPSGGENVWPVTSLVIGGTEYSDTDLCYNLNLPGQGNAVRILSHQLIAALLNIANGATPPPNCDIDAASALLTGLNINTASVATSTTLGQQMTAAALCLDLYNNGDGGVTHCP